MKYKWRQGAEFDLFLTFRGRVLKVSGDDGGWWFRRKKKDAAQMDRDYPSVESAKRACLRYWKKELTPKRGGEGAE